MKKDNKIFTAFFQGKDETAAGAGNCASIAIIKAAIYTFGDQIFQEWSQQENRYNIILKNGDQVTFTQEEFDYAKEEASFILGEAENEADNQLFVEMRELAYLSFTAICKMVQIHGDYSSRLKQFIIPEDFKTAVEIINDGTDTPDVYELLGLEDHVTPIYRWKIKKRTKSDTGMVIWTKGHAMFAAKGYFDLYGNRIKIRNRVMRILPGNVISGMFKLKA